MSEWPQTVKFHGRQEVTILPSYGIREALVRGAGRVEADVIDARLPWACAALVGACTSVGGKAKQTLRAHGYDVIEYGQAVYSWIRESGASEADVLEAGTELLGALAGSLITAEEVKNAADFSEGTAA
jgi:hypothetical protein